MTYKEIMELKRGDEVFLASIGEYIEIATVHIDGDIVTIVDDGDCVHECESEGVWF